jgi:sulfate adenylyltransferase
MGAVRSVAAVEGASLSSIATPHGGVLVDRFVDAQEADALRDRARSLPSLILDPREKADLELIATGAASPLSGFLGANDYESVLRHMRLASGTIWPLPLTLAVGRGLESVLERAGGAALEDEVGRLWGVIRVEEIFERDPRQEALSIYGTDDPAHPGVAYVLSRPRRLVGGQVQVLPLPEDLPFARYRFSPTQLREEIRLRGWKRVAGFQTRNPIHRAHEHLTKIALEATDGLVIHPLVGETKTDDVPAEVRFRAYETLVELYYPKDRTLLAAFPAAMRYAGPREALFHAIVRKNYGITHLVVGRDHAGVGSFYGPFDAHAIFDRFPTEELGVQPLRLDVAFFCRACGQHASARTCPHDGAERLELSGTKVREVLRAGGDLPLEFTRPEVARILQKHYSGGDTKAGQSTDPSLLPLFLKLEGRSVVIVGGGRLAATKAHGLIKAGARLTIVAPEIRPDLRSLDAAFIQRCFGPADLEGAWLVVAAATPEVNREVAKAAEAQRIWVNGVDDPESATAFAGGVLRRGPITIALSTGGESPALVRLLREAFDSLLPDDIVRWIEESRTQRRQWRAEGVPIERRRGLLLDALNKLYAPSGVGTQGDAL